MKLVTCLFLMLLVCVGYSTPAFAGQGSGSLWVPDATSTPTHWNVEIGTEIYAEIQGVEITPLPETIPVWIKSSFYGNTEITATHIGDGTYAFTYTPPLVIPGSGILESCGTTIVSYGTVGNNANNDLIDDGEQNGSNNAACGFRYLYLGAPNDCLPTPVEISTWGTIKSRFSN